MSQNRKNFYIARIDVDKEEKTNKSNKETKFVPEEYVSSVSGRNVKDKIDYPYVKFGNGGYQYEGLKDKSERSEEYERRIQHQEYSNGTVRKSIPSYLMREDITPQKKGIASYPTNERTFIEKTVQQTPQSVTPQTMQPVIQEFEEEVVVSQPVRHDYVDNGERVSFEETKQFFANREKQIIDSNNAQNVKRTEPIYEEKLVINKAKDEYIAPPVPETRPVYSTPDSTDDDPFMDIELDLYVGNTEIEELDPYGTETIKSPIKKEKPVVETRVVHENYDTRHIEMPQTAKPRKKIKYVAPNINLLHIEPPIRQSDNSGTQHQRKRIDETLEEFGVGGHVTNFDRGPAVTRFEIKLDPGVKVEKIKSISRNLQMNLESRTLRMQAPIPGKATVGIEVPNLKTDVVFCGELLGNKDILNDGNPINVVLGRDVTGSPVYLDISNMPHGLIAGTPGSGKSVCINTIIMSILYKASPDQVKLILVDPKLIEFSNYEDIPHLATPVINDPKLAAEALKWACDEMQRRYELFKTYKRRDYASYKELCDEDSSITPIPYIVIIIDELNDLMMAAAKSVEESITRLAQKARAAGIHLLLATQRPSTDVISGTIKANILARIAFSVTSQIDSRTILDHPGAEQLLGKGDMLYTDGVIEQRVQGAFVSLSEIIKVTDDIKSRYKPDFIFTSEDLKKRVEVSETGGEDIRMDEFFEPVARWIVENDSASINRIQKTFGIGFNRAQALMEGFEEYGIVSENVGTKQRTVLIDMDDLEGILER